ncbi:hypothetical protein ACFQE8_07805 [Salinirubellus sp. GCM10025818]|uniref:hypothetical protein n=1 Tax=Salinirubellus TaxID=2162630 RepID=UPI0030CCCA7E
MSEENDGASGITAEKGDPHGGVDDYATWSDWARKLNREVVLNPFRALAAVAVALVLLTTDLLSTGDSELVLAAIFGAIIGKYFDLLSEALYLVFDSITGRLLDRFGTNGVIVGQTLLFLFLGVVATFVAFGVSSYSAAGFVLFALYTGYRAFVNAANQ